mmetsp:Transcript_111216/g.354233  ORF Transcript_111216/g.354233 Transcript_111216/m.354233 type:complete len:941 (-) Transcript_111216:544-3366(-)
MEVYTWWFEPKLLLKPTLPSLELVAECSRPVLVHRDILALILDAELVHGVLGHLRLDLALAREGREGAHANGLGVDLKKSPQLLAGVGSAEAVGAEVNDVATAILLDELVILRDVVRGDDGDAVVVTQAVVDPAALLRLHGVQPAVALGLEGLAVKLADVGGAPDLDTDAVLGQEGHGAQGLLHDGAGADHPDGHGLVGGGLLELVQALQHCLLRGDATSQVFWHLRHGVVLVVQRDVVDQVLVLAPHLVDAILDDISQLVGEGWIPGNARRVGDREKIGVAVLVLQTFAVERGPAGRGAQEEAPGAGIRGLPDEVADALEAEHRVVDEERKHGAALGGVRCAAGNPSAQRTGLRDAFLQDLTIRGLGVLHQNVVVHRCVVLAEGGVNLELVEERIHTEGSGFVCDHGDAPLAEVAHLHEFPQQARECHRRAHGLWVALVEESVGDGLGNLDDAADLRGLPRGVEPAEPLTLLDHVLDLGGVHARIPEELAALALTATLDLLVCERDVEHGAEAHELVVLHGLLLVHRVSALEGRKTESLQGLRQDDTGPSTALGIFLGLQHGGIDFLVVVASGLHVRGDELCIGEVGDAVPQAVVVEHLLAQQCSVLLCGITLAISIGRSLQHLDEPAIRIIVHQLVPLATPDELNAVEASTAEHSLKLLDDLGIPSDRPIQALVVAIHDHDQIVQPLVARPGNGVDGLRLVHLAVADEAPDAARGGVGHATEVQVAEEASLRDRDERADAHGHRGVLPEVGHEPRVWVARHALAAHLLAEIHDPLEAEAALEVRTGIRSRRGVPLHVDLVALAATVGLASEEVVHADLPDVANGGEGADVPAHTHGTLVAIADHDRRVPADEVGDPALHRDVAWVYGFHARRDAVDHRRGDGRGHLHALAHGFVHQLVQHEARPRGPVVLDDGIEGLDPLLGFRFVEDREVRTGGDHG